MFRIYLLVGLMICLSSNSVQAKYINESLVPTEFEESSHEESSHEESIFQESLLRSHYSKGFVRPRSDSVFIVPGTKWCGPGDQASNYNDLGVERDTDICCRGHDHCEDIIDSESKNHGLKNTDLFPIFNCACERKFLNCLQKVNTLFSNMIGDLYFFSRSQCFSKGYPIIKCSQYQLETSNDRCIRYKTNKKESKIWQFYDTPYYTISD